MKNNGSAESQYFSCRNISPEHYRDFQLPKYLLAVLPEDKNARMLDIGCGFGQMLKCLKQRGYLNIYGIDISKEAIEYCRSIGLNVEESANLEEYSRKHLHTFDFIIMSHVLEHIEKQQIIGTLSSVKKLLAKNGKLMIMVPNAQSNTDCYWAYEDFTHTTLFTAGSLFYVLKAADFEQIKFLDPECLEGHCLIRRIIKQILLRIYIMNKEFWNRVTGSSYHKPSPKIFGFEIKALAE